MYIHIHIHIYIYTWAITPVTNLQPQFQGIQKSALAFRLGCGHALVHHILRDLQTICTRIFCGLRCENGEASRGVPVGLKRNHGKWNLKGTKKKQTTTHVLYVVTLKSLKSCFIWKSWVTSLQEYALHNPGHLPWRSLPPHRWPRLWSVLTCSDLRDTTCIHHLRRKSHVHGNLHLGMGQNLVPLVNPKIAGKWMFIPLKMYL